MTKLDIVSYHSIQYYQLIKKFKRAIISVYYIL